MYLQLKTNISNKGMQLNCSGVNGVYDISIVIVYAIMEVVVLFVLMILVQCLVLLS